MLSNDGRPYQSFYRSLGTLFNGPALNWRCDSDCFAGGTDDGAAGSWGPCGSSTSRLTMSNDETGALSCRSNFESRTVSGGPDRKSEANTWRVSESSASWNGWQADAELCPHMAARKEHTVRRSRLNAEFVRERSATARRPFTQSTARKRPAVH